MSPRTALLFCLATFFALAIPFSSADSLQAQDLADVIEKSELSVARIEVEGRAGESLGSGFVVESSGVIVTNVHVLAGAQKATATFANGKSYKIEGTYYFDESRDICIAQVDGDDFPTIVVSRVAPRKGETVTALGAPRGLSFTATTGIVSAMRSGEQLGKDRKGTWIQIDAALSPGNSGGPLINGKGRVIAMSTLASTGDSQNLNFGISATDIREAISTSRDYDLISLPEGVGEIEVDESGGGGGPENMIDRPPIPDQALAKYIEDCREDYKSLRKKVIRDASAADKEFRLVRSGDVPLPRGYNGQGDGVIMVHPRTKKEKYYFRTDRVKDRRLREAEKKATDLKEVKDALEKTVTDKSLHELLKFTGQYLDTADKGSIGIMPNAQVVHPFNDHDAIIDFDDQPYLLWLPSTSGMSRGSEIEPITVFVSGTETVLIPGGSTMSLTILIGLKDSEIKQAIFGDKRMANKGKAVVALTRTWTAGSHSVKAKVIRVGKAEVTLQKNNGKTIVVKRSLLSEADNKYLSELE